MTPSTQSEGKNGASHNMYHAPSSGSSSSSTNDSTASISAGINTKVSISQNQLNQSANVSKLVVAETMVPLAEAPPTAISQDNQVFVIPLSFVSSQISPPTATEKPINDTVKSKEMKNMVTFLSTVNSCSDHSHQANARSMDKAKKAQETKYTEEEGSSSSDPSRIFVPSHVQVLRNSPWNSSLANPVPSLPPSSLLVPDSIVSTARVPVLKSDLSPGIPESIDVSVQSQLSPTPSKKQQTATGQPTKQTTPMLRSDIAYSQSLPPNTPSSDSPSPPGSSKGSLSSAVLRRGKWTIEEESYVARVIQDFNSGYLNTPAGTTLRSYLSDKLHCDPMRITKKFTGDSCIGKRVFHPAVRCPSNAVAIDKAQAELDALERRWRRRLEMQQRESAKKVAASAAAAVVGRTLLQGIQSSLDPTPVSSASHYSTTMKSQYVTDSAVTRTASWLDRANAILSPTISILIDGDPDRAISALPETAIEDQMKAVERLLHEGPIIQQTTAGLPYLLDQENNPYRCSEAMSVASHDSGSVDPPRDKRPRKFSDTGAEDAEALLGFVNTVRAAAAGRQGSE